jgi:hypothetical protein
MNQDEIGKFLEIDHFKLSTKLRLKQILKEHPIFIIIDGKDQPFAASYNPDNDNVSFAKLNPVNALIYCISRRVDIPVFSDALKNDLIEAVDAVLKNYNINLEEGNGSNIQDKISGDGSPKS